MACEFPIVVKRSRC